MAHLIKVIYIQRFYAWYDKFQLTVQETSSLHNTMLNYSDKCWIKNCIHRIYPISSNILARCIFLSNTVCSSLKINAQEELHASVTGWSCWRRLVHLWTWSVKVNNTELENMFTVVRWNIYLPVHAGMK